MGLDDDIAAARLDIEEIKQLIEISKRPNVQMFLTVEQRRRETKVVELLARKDALGANDQGSRNSSSGVKEEARVYTVAIKNYSWDQSDKFVKFYLTNLKNVQALPKETAFEKSFETKSVSFKILGLEGKNHLFEIKELADSIVPEKSYFTVKSDMVMIYLAKAGENTKWSHVTKAEKVAADKKNASSVPKMDENEDPSKGLMKMMQKMYEEGDDDMKRTIAKAWTESQSKNREGRPDLDF